jgi:hypothetical protein
LFHRLFNGEAKPAPISIDVALRMASGLMALEGGARAAQGEMMGDEGQ